MEDNIKALKAIGDFIREERKRKMYSQRNLAKTIGIDITYMGRIERGEANFSILHLLKISRGLNIKPSRIFEGIYE